MNERTSKAERWHGLWWIMLSAAGFGAMAIFAKIAYAAGVTLSTMLFLRFMIAGLLLAAWGSMHGMCWPRGRDLLWLILMGAIGYVGQAYCYFSALKYASAGLVALLLYLYPAIVTLLSALLYRRKIGAGRTMAVTVALAGTALTVGGDLSSQPLGILLGIAAALIYSLYIIAGERVMPRVGALPAAAVVMLSAAVVYGGAASVEGLAMPQSLQGWLAVVAIAIFSTLLAILGFFKGLEKLGAADASTLSTLEPLVTIGLAFLILGEAVTVVQLAGGALILAAVIYLARHDGEQTDQPRV
ncbi:DMT family transporter [Sulfuricystis thermophila]|uniref:DMT family transporter n=1 Tax=Sulfuricystis thermophila TaxID=2496847 RepID=UPI00103653C0|nr:DMT family transporter [Sulfuricystis thermophila]